MNTLTLIKVDLNPKSVDLPAGEYLSYFDSIIVSEQTYIQYYSSLSPYPMSTFFRSPL